MGDKGVREQKIHRPFREAQRSRQNAGRMEKGARKQNSRCIKNGRIQQFRENTWLSSFHLFGFVTELAFTFQPLPFQLTFTARSSRTKSHLFHHPLNTLWIVSYSGPESPLALGTNSCIFEKRLMRSPARRIRQDSGKKMSRTHVGKAVTVPFF